MDIPELGNWWFLIFSVPVAALVIHFGRLLIAAAAESRIRKEIKQKEAKRKETEEAEQTEEPETENATVVEEQVEVESTATEQEDEELEEPTADQESSNSERKAYFLTADEILPALTDNQGEGKLFLESDVAEWLADASALRPINIKGSDSYLRLDLSGFFGSGENSVRPIHNAFKNVFSRLPFSQKDSFNTIIQLRSDDNSIKDLYKVFYQWLEMEWEMNKKLIPIDLVPLGASLQDYKKDLEPGRKIIILGVYLNSDNQDYLNQIICDVQNLKSENDFDIVGGLIMFTDNFVNQTNLSTINSHGIFQPFSFDLGNKLLN